VLEDSCHSRLLLGGSLDGYLTLDSWTLLESCRRIKFRQHATCREAQTLNSSAEYKRCNQEGARHSSLARVTSVWRGGGGPTLCYTTTHTPDLCDLR
jgi:hypothetical protein